MKDKYEAEEKFSGGRAVANAATVATTAASTTNAAATTVVAPTTSVATVWLLLISVATTDASPTTDNYFYIWGIGRMPLHQCPTSY